MENSQHFQGAKAKIHVEDKMSSTEIKMMLQATAAVNQSSDLVLNLQFHRESKL